MTMAPHKTPKTNPRTENRVWSWWIWSKGAGAAGLDSALTPAG